MREIAPMGLAKRVACALASAALACGHSAPGTEEPHEAGTPEAGAPDTMAPPASACAYTKLRVDGDRIVNADGCGVQLRGVTVEGLLGGHSMGFWGESTTLDGADIALTTGWPRMEAYARDAFGDEIGRLWDAWRQAILGQDDLTRIRQLGFDVIRVWMDHRLLVRHSDDTWRESGFRAIERMLDDAEAAGVYVLFGLGGPFDDDTTDACTTCGPFERLGLDSASDTLDFFDKPAAQQAFYRLGEELARRYSHRVGLFGWDLLLEPITLQPQKLSPIHAEAVERMRAAEPAEPAVLVLQGTILPPNLSALVPPEDPNVAFAVHWYVPWEVTNEGTAAYPGVASNQTWPPFERQYDRAVIFDWLSYASDFQAAVPRPLLLDAGVLRQACRWLEDGSEYPGSWSAEQGSEPCPPLAPGELSSAGRWITDNFDYFSQHGWHWTFSTYKSTGPWGHGLLYTNSFVYEDVQATWEGILQELSGCVAAHGPDACVQQVLDSEKWQALVAALRPPALVEDAERLPLLQAYLER